MSSRGWERGRGVPRLGVLAAFLATSALSAGEWPQFRGPGGTAVADGAPLPSRWGEGQNVRWRVELPGQGLSSPVVAAGRVYVTASSGFEQRRLHVLCFDAATGKRLWERQLAATGNTLCHPKTFMAAPTPVADGRRVYALFATGDLACFDRDGDLLWYRALALDRPQITNQIGMAASPVLAGEVLLVPLENLGDSFAAGLDAATGRDRWKVARPRQMNWVTPLLRTQDGRAEAVFQTSEEATAYDPATGRVLWTFAGKGLFPDPAVPSPVEAGDLVILSGGVALRPGSDGAAPQVVWKSSKLRPAYASPVYYRDRLYVVNNSAILLNCADARTGKVLWQQRAKGPFSASPVAGDGKVYLVNEEGTATVFEAGDEPHVLAVNVLKETVLATPALAGGALFLRGEHHLYCIAEK